MAVLAVCACSAARAGDDDVSSKRVVHRQVHGYARLEESVRSAIRDQLQRALAAGRAADARSAAAAVRQRHRRSELAGGSGDQSTRSGKTGREAVSPKPDYVTDSSRPLRPNELNAVNAPGTNDQSSPSDRGTKKAGILSFDWLKQEDYGTFTGEPPRVSLTDPPPGYQTPSPDQPYGIVPEKKIYKPPTLGERMEPVQ